MEFHVNVHFGVRLNTIVVFFFPVKYLLAYFSMFEKSCWYSFL